MGVGRDKDIQTCPDKIFMKILSETQSEMIDSMRNSNSYGPSFEFWTKLKNVPTPLSTII